LQKTILKSRSFIWILYPFALFYWIIVLCKNTFYKYGLFSSRKLPCSVISVGNLTVGGTGKTILVIYLARLLQKKNKKVAILTRGYGRKKRGHFLVTDGQSILKNITANHCGDEPFLMAKFLKEIPIMIDKNRYRGGLNLVKQFQPDVILLDDGFQHRSLFRDLDIVLVNAQDEKSNHKILPIGLLREPWENINRSDVIILTKYNLRSDNSYLLKKLKNTNKTVIKAQLISQLSSLYNQSDLDFNKLIKKLAFVFAGIGDTKSLIKSINKLGVKISGTKFFKDHHLYNETDLNNIYIEAKKVNAKYLITTEKDWVKTQSFMIDFPIIILNASFKIESESQLNKLIDQKISDFISETSPKQTQPQQK